MRSALLTWDMPPVPTGLGRAANEIARGLLAAGVDVTVFSADREGVESVDGLRIVGCRPGRWRTHWRRRTAIGHHAMPALFADAVMRDHHRRAFDLVEATNWYMPGAAVRGLPSVVRMSTPAIDARDRAAPWRARADLAYAHRMERRTVRRARGLISNTHPHAAKMRDVYGIADDTPHDVIGLSLCEQTVRDGAALPWPKNEPPAVLFVGRTERRKGFDEMLEGFLLWRTRRPDAVLRIVGLASGDLARRCRALGLHPGGSVVDLGRASDGDMQDALARSQIVLAPSRYESYGLVYREAAAAGRALVASRDDPSATDYVARTGAGVLAKRTEPHAIAQALEEGWQRRNELRAAGLAHATTLSRAALGTATAAFYERVLSASRGRRT